MDHANEQMKWLLKLRFPRFASHMLYDPQLGTFIDTFLQFRRRHFDPAQAIATPEALKFHWPHTRHLTSVLYAPLLPYSPLCPACITSKRHSPHPPLLPAFNARKRLRRRGGWHGAGGGVRTGVEVGVGQGAGRRVQES